MTKPLTPREQQICEVLLKQPGLTLRGVSRQMGIDRETVNWHLDNVYAKLQVQSKSELMKNLCNRAPPPNG